MHFRLPAAHTIRRQRYRAMSPVTGPPAWIRSASGILATIMCARYRTQFNVRLRVLSVAPPMVPTIWLEPDTVPVNVNVRPLTSVTVKVIAGSVNVPLTAETSTGTPLPTATVPGPEGGSRGNTRHSSGTQLVLIVTVWPDWTIVRCQ